MRYDTIKNDVSYIRYNEVRKQLINMLEDDDADQEKIRIYIDMLNYYRSILNEILLFRKEEADGRNITE